MTNYIFDRIDKLIERCDSYDPANPSAVYDEIVYEMDELLLSLLGKGHNSYDNFRHVYRANATCRAKQIALKGVLQGVKDSLALSKNKKYQFFISSTYKDLIGYRKAVADEITFRGHIPAGMEDFTACGEDLEAYIKKVIDRSDYYVLIIGQRFGSPLPTDCGISYTMMEYMYAKEKNMRIIPFIYNGKDELEGNDLNENKERFDKFTSMVSKSVPQYFANKDELVKKLTKALDNEIADYPQKGWIRL